MTPNGTPSPATAARPTLALLFAGVLMAALDIAIVGPALPALAAQFAVDDRTLSWVFGLYVLFNLIGAPLLGKASDRVGRRRVYMLCVALFAAGSALVAFAPSFGVLLAGRAVQAFGAGGIFPVASAVIAQVVPEARRGRALGLIGAVFGIAFLLGPLLGGLLLRFGWPWLFLINLPIAAVVFAASVRWLPADPPRRAQAPFDIGGAATLALLLACAAWGVNRLEGGSGPSAWLSPQVWPFLLAALAAAAAFAVIERRASDPLLPPALLGTARRRAIVIIAVAAGLVEAGMVFLPALAVDSFRVSAATASLMMLPLVLALTVGAPTAGMLLDRFGARPVVQLGLGATAAGLAVFAVEPLGLVAFYAAGLLVGLGLSGLLGAPLRYVVLAEAGPARRGAGQGLLTLSLGAGQLLGAAAIGAWAASAGPEATGRYAAALWPLAIVCAAVWPLTLTLAGRRTAPGRLAADEAESGS